MSYNVRDVNATLGPLAAVEFPNGAAAAVQAKIQAMEPASLTGDAANFTTAHAYTIFVNPTTPSVSGGVPNLGGSYQVVAASVYAGTASTSGTLALEICPPGTADGSGNNVLSSTTTSLAASGTGVGTSTPGSLTLNANVDNLILPANGRLNAVFGGTLSSLVNFNVVVYLVRIS